jgi:hypothetical protein
MKKRILFMLLAAMMLVSACGGKTGDSGESLISKIAEEKVDPFYKEMKDKENIRPIAVMIDNDSDKARPQIGLEDAYMVYEIVVEGRATRFMALFKDYDLEKVGPVRSSRHYFLDYAMEHDAVYGHAGWSPKAAKDINSLKINNINGVAGDGACFWRDNTYDRTWHNLYTSTVKLSEYAKDKKNYRLETDNKIPDYHKLEKELENGVATTTVSIPYANFYKVKYVYDETTKRYVRYVNNKEHKSQTGEAFSTKNIIVYQLKNTPLPDKEDKDRQDLENIGSGTGYYLTNGKMVNIKWEKTARDAKTTYTLEDGTPLKLNPGNTYIQIVPLYATPTFE